MILGFDIGNTHIVTGLFSQTGEIKLRFRVSSDEKLTEDEFFTYLKTISDFKGVKIENVEGIVISSVVPSITSIFMYLAKRYFDIEPIIVDSTIKLPLKFDVDNPKELGADRISNSVAGVMKFGDKNLIIIDFGTATTFDVIKNKTYIGGCILPGISMSINALVKNTARLPKVRIEKPKSVIGKNTVEHINNGIYYGYIGQLKELIARIKSEIESPYIITTGGLAQIVSSEIADIDEIIPDLNLEGLYLIYKFLKG